VTGVLGREKGGKKRECSRDPKKRGEASHEIKKSSKKRGNLRRNTALTARKKEKDHQRKNDR